MVYEEMQALRFYLLPFLIFAIMPIFVAVDAIKGKILVVKHNTGG